jgi:hypothetical protein
MDIPVFVTTHDSCFQARMGSPFDLVAEGPTADAALEAVHELLRDKLKNGCTVRSIRVNDVDSILAAAQKVGESPLYDEYLEALADYRRQHNTVPDAD